MKETVFGGLDKIDLTSPIKKKTPKEWFLSKVYSALLEFEETTGVEVLKIEIDRLDLDETGKTSNVESPSKFIQKWKLTLR